MNFFRHLLKKKNGEPAHAASARDVRALIKPLCETAVQIVKTTDATFSYLGGLPEMPNAMAWPTINDRPLAFLASLCLKEIGEAQRFEWLPPTGKLLFFYDIEGQPWGFDPKDAGSWQVNYLESDTANLAKTPPPQGLTIECLIPKINISFRLIDSSPGWERDAVTKLNLTDQEFDLLSDLQTEAFEDNPMHQMGGYPYPMQGDQMELECQLVTNGLYCGDASGYQDPRAKELQKGVADWQLLFQMDSDDDLNLMWGDAGLIYFWIRKQDAMAKSFEKTWLVLQCG